MSMNPTVARHLNEAMAELRAQQAEIEAAIKQLTLTIESLGGQPTAASASGHAAFSGAGSLAASGSPIAPPMKDAVLDYMREVDRDVTTAEVAQKLTSLYDWSQASVRSLMSKLAKDQVIGNPRRGVYNLDPSTTLWRTSETSEAPDDRSGASAEVAPSRAQGGEFDQQAPIQGDRSSFGQRDDHPDDRTSIVR